MPMSSVRIAAAVAAILSCAHAAAQEAQPIKLDIPAQRLDKALNAWADQTGYQVMISADDPVARERKAPKVEGTYTPEGALKVLLASSDLKYQFVSDRAVTIRSAAEGKPETAASQAPVNASPASGPEHPLALAQSRPREQKEAANLESTGTTYEKNSSTAAPTIEEVVVTGTHLRDVLPDSLVITLSRVEMDRAAATNTGDLMRLLPQNFGGGQNAYNNLATGNSFENGSNPGSATGIDLRGLGSNATLILLNGRPLAPAGINGSVDVAAIPISALDRIEVVTDGATSAYGADAIGGVVNFIIRRGYEGADSSASYGAAAGSTGSEFRLSQTLGKAWSGGDAFVALDYSNRRPIYSFERPYSESLDPTNTLSPSALSRTFLGTATQTITENFNAFIQGLYTKRDSRYVDSLFGTDQATNRATESQVAATGGLNSKLRGDWASTLSFTFARDNTDLQTMTNSSGVPLPDTRSTYRNTVKQIELSANGSAFAVSARPAKVALGIGYKTLVPEIALDIATPKQSARYAFAELNLPIATRGPDSSDQTIGMSAGVRYDDYNDFGSAISPKVGITLSPIRSLRLRGTWGKSFHAPDPFKLYAPTTVFFYNVPEGVAPGAPFNTILEAGGNPKLGAEKATSYTAGLEWAPIQSVAISSNFYDIDFRNRITQPSLDIFGVLTDPTYQNQVHPNPSPATIADVAGRATNIFDLTNGDPLSSAAYYVDGRTFNAATLRTNGIDLIARWTIPGSDVDLSLNANKVLTYELQNSGTVPFSSKLDRIFYVPSLRARAEASAKLGAVSATLAVNYTHGYLNDSTIDSTPINQAVASWTTFDTVASYNLGDRGIAVLSGTALRVSIYNLFDRDPPYARLFTPIGYDTTNADPRGRYVTVTLQKHW